ncbi:MAG: hypothetical protein F9K42_05375 [Ignavibacterium sp.]|nr:MAG: hypothetical protein F9K42_05375 [Ignavibacterium sp.]
MKKLKSKQQELSLKEESELSEMLLEKLKSLADFKSDVSNEILASGIVHRAAKSLKLDHRLYLNNAALESVVFEECIKEQIELLKKNINKMNPEELEKMEHLLTEELTKLSSADREAIKKSLKIDYISGKALLTFIKTASATAMIQMILGSFGFGFFLFLTTMMKAMGLLFGITFSFGAYTTLSTVAGFILSLPFLLISVLVAGGVITKFTNSKIEDEIVKTIIVIGKSKLL